ncbi:unnamed protein product, partial [Adineta steineri]
MLATLVRNALNENKMRIIYEYLAEASLVFPKERVRSICHGVARIFRPMGKLLVPRKIRWAKWARFLSMVQKVLA